MVRSLRSVLLMALGLAVLVRLLDRWSESRLRVPAADEGGEYRLSPRPVTARQEPVTAEADGDDEVALRLREANEAVRRLNETFAEIAAVAERPAGPSVLRNPSPAAPGPTAAAAAGGVAVVEQAAARSVVGTCSITGVSVGSGHVVWSQVLFPERLESAPTGWAREDGQVWAPGTLLVDVTASMNCTPDDVGVVFAIGHSPTPDSFTLRITCTQAGPFAAVGTYRVV